MWLLIRFRELGASQSQLLTLWQQRGRSILEFASPVFFSSLTQDQSRLMETCQRVAFKIILRGTYTSYSQALSDLQQERLDTRRLTAALTWGRKCINNPRYSDMFPLYKQNRPNLRKSNMQFEEYHCRSQRMYNSSLPTICRMLNENVNI